MSSNQPITDAVYGKRSTHRKPSSKPQRRRVNSLIGQIIGEDAVAELYRKLGFKHPNQRPKRGR